jgi:hypothetical protein
LHWNYLGSYNIIVNLQILICKIQNYQIITEVDMVYTKVIALSRIYNSAVENFCI